MKFGLQTPVITQIQNILERYPAIDKVIIYGSRAKGNYRNGSDIDLVLFGKHLTTSDLLQMEMEIDDLMLPYMVDLSLYHQIDNESLKAHINRVGKIFYEKNKDITPS